MYKTLFGVIQTLNGIKLLILAITLVAFNFCLQGHVGFNLWDEGFLWYGAQRTMLGEVPIRDFQAYDPGRYYWSATFMSFFGNNGILSLRVAVAIFQIIGLFTGLTLIAKAAKNHNNQTILFLLIAAITLLVWMFPRHKLFDLTLSILLIGVLTFLINNPSFKRYFISGLCVGFLAVFGRNHGMYGALASLGVMAWLNIKRTSEVSLIKGLVIWAFGVITGFLPVLLMILLVPGFAIAFWQSIVTLFESKATNLPLPVPWPWKIDFNTLPIGSSIREVLVGLFFIAIILYAIISIFWVIRQRHQTKYVPPAFVAASFSALPYAHYAYSRADVGHLAHSIFPLLIGCLVLANTLNAKAKWVFVLTLCAASIWVMHVFHPGWLCYIHKQCEIVEISANQLQVDFKTAKEVRKLRQLAADFAPNGESFVVTPFWPGAYSLLERKAPMWEIYALFPGSPTFQKAEINRIKAANPKFVFVFDYALDGRDDLRFKNTHALINNYIQKNFDRTADLSNPAYQIYKSKESQ